MTLCIAFSLGFLAQHPFVDNGIPELLVGLELTFGEGRLLDNLQRLARIFVL